MRRMLLFLMATLFCVPAFAEMDWDSGEESGKGRFDQHMFGWFQPNMMEIPAGLTNVDVKVKSTAAFYIAVSEGDKTLIYGYVGSSNEDKQEIEYNGLTIELKESNKRYEGKKADLKIRGELQSTLKVSIGAPAGTDLRVDYKWGKGVGKPCGSRALKPCEPGLVCKDGIDGNIAVDVPGECHTKLWCEIEKDCQGLVKVDGPDGQYICENQHREQ